MLLYFYNLSCSCVCPECKTKLLSFSFSIINRKTVFFGGLFFGFFLCFPCTLWCFTLCSFHDHKQTQTCKTKIKRWLHAGYFRMKGMSQAAADLLNRCGAAGGGERHNNVKSSWSTSSWGVALLLLHHGTLKHIDVYVSEW